MFLERKKTRSKTKPIQQYQAKSCPSFFFFSIIQLGSLLCGVHISRCVQLSYRIISDLASYYISTNSLLLFILQLSILFIYCCTFVLSTELQNNTKTHVHSMYARTKGHFEIVDCTGKLHEVRETEKPKNQKNKQIQN